MYALSLEQLNLLLAFCEYPTVRSTYDFDVVDFGIFISNFECRDSPTSQQLVITKYYECCKKRLTDNFKIVDFQYKKV